MDMVKTAPKSAKIRTRYDEDNVIRKWEIQGYSHSCLVVLAIDPVAGSNILSHRRCTFVRLKYLIFIDWPVFSGSRPCWLQSGPNPFISQHSCHRSSESD